MSHDERISIYWRHSSRWMRRRDPGVCPAGLHCRSRPWRPRDGAEAAS